MADSNNILDKPRHKCESDSDKMSSIEDVIDDLGGFGRIQWRMAILKMYIFTNLGWSMLQMAFSGIIPDWYCVINDHESSSPSPLSPNLTLGNSSMQLRTCAINGTVCDAYVFNEKPRTIINQWSLVCDLEWVKPIVTSIQMAGVLAGCFLAGYIGDHFGRKKSSIFFLVCHVASNLVTGFATSWIMFAVCRFIIGASIGGSLVVLYVYCLEFMPTKWRSYVALIPAWAMGYCLLALLALLVNDSPKIHLINAAAMAPGIVAHFFVPESIRWLAVHDRLDDAMDACRKVARLHKVPLSPRIRGILEDIAREEAAAKGNYNYFDIFKDGYLCKTTLIICYFWFAMSLVTYGISFSASNFAGSFSLNLFFIATSDLPAIAIALLLINRVGRKATTMFLFTVTTLCTLGCIVVLKAAPETSKDLMLSILAICAKASGVAGWGAIATWGPELYPTVIRSLSYGAHNTCARIGGIVAPFLINLDKMPIISFASAAGLSLFIVLFSILLPETKGKALQDTMSAHKKGLNKEKQKKSHVIPDAVPLNDVVRENEEKA